MHADEDIRAIFRDDLRTQNRVVVELPTGALVIARTAEDMEARLLALGYPLSWPSVLKSELDLNTNPREHKDRFGDVKFNERENKITFDREHVSDDDLIDALKFAQSKLGHGLKLTCDDEVFLKRMARSATRHGIKVTNPELQDYIESIQPPKVVPFRRMA